MSEVRQQRPESNLYAFLYDQINLPSSLGLTEKSNIIKNIVNSVFDFNLFFAKDNFPSFVQQKTCKQLNYQGMHIIHTQVTASKKRIEDPSPTETSVKTSNAKSRPPLNAQNNEISKENKSDGKLVPLTSNHQIIPNNQADSSNDNPINFPNTDFKTILAPISTERKKTHPIDELVKIYQKHEANMRRIKKLRRLKKKFDKTLSIFHHNYELFLVFLDLFPESFKVVKVNLKGKKELIKHLKAIFPVPYFKLHFMKIYLQELKNFNNRVDLDKRIEEINLKIYELEKKFYIKFVELLTRKLLPFIIYSPLCVSYFPSIESFEKKAFIKTSNFFFKSFKNSSKLREYCRFNKKIKKWLNRQESVKINQHVNENTKKISFDEEEQFKINVDDYFGIARTILVDNAFNFNNFKKILLEKKYVSKRLNNICSWEEFDQEAKKNGLDKLGFLKEICKDNVRYHMTFGKLFKNAVLQMLMCKSKTEQKFLIYNSIQCIINLIADIVQLFLITPKTAQFLTAWGIKKPLDNLANILGKDISIPKIKLLLIANSDLDFSVLGLVNMVANQVFGYIYKPNEYSLEGCIISLQKRKQDIVYSASYLFLKMFLITFELSDKILKFTRSKFASAKLNPVLASNQESSLTAPIPIAETNNTQSCLNSHTYKYLNESLNKTKAHYDKNIKKLNKKLKKLKELDLQKDLNPDYCPNISEKDISIKYLKVNDCPKPLLKKFTDSDLTDKNTNEEVNQFLKSKSLFKLEEIKHKTKYNYDGIDVILELLEKSDPHLFTKDIKEFLINDLNFSLNKDISTQLKKLLFASDDKFFNLLGN